MQRAAEAVHKEPSFALLARMDGVNHTLEVDCFFVFTIRRRPGVNARLRTRSDIGGVGVCDSPDTN